MPVVITKRSNMAKTRRRSAKNLVDKTSFSPKPTTKRPDTMTTSTSESSFRKERAVKRDFKKEEFKKKKSSSSSNFLLYLFAIIIIIIAYNISQKPAKNTTEE